MTAELLTRVREWLAQDPDPETRAELTALLDEAEGGAAAAVAELEARFAGRLQFGTAGLRAELGAGPLRMNRVVVAQTTRGFADFLLQRAVQGATSNPPSIVIGYDARRNSAVFAQDAAEIMQGAGVQVTLLPAALPTPVTAFAVRHLGASAGVMVTASHNPPNDNGYKVYLGDADAGSQIVPPADAQIAAAIAAAAEIPLAEYKRSSEYTLDSGAVLEAYIAQTVAFARPRVPQVSAVQQPRLVYTAMHGVGGEISAEIFAQAGLPRLHPVPEQQAPDGAFPTVSFPNPEELGALDLAIATAQQLDADAIIAHDPDADRLAVALPRPETGDWQMLTGNQLGLLLGWQAAARSSELAAHPAGGTPQADGAHPRPALACTIVSSPALRAVAEHYGLGYAETLSGFKWVSRVPGLIFGYEEALGYLVDTAKIRDKDGISAACVIASLITDLHAQGKTLWDHLDAAAAQFGYFASSQVTVRLESMQAVEQLAAKLRETPLTAVGDLRVVSTTDLLVPGAAEQPANVLRYDLEGDARLMVRPSGTEPKLKLYLDVVSREGSVAERQSAAAAALAELQAGVTELLEQLQR